MLALCRALEGRTDEALRLLDEARSLNPGYQESVLLEWAAIVDWVRGDFPAVLAHAREALKWSPEGLARRRGLGVAFAAVAAVESDDLIEAGDYVRKLEAAYEGRDWWFFDDYRRWAQAALERRSGRLEDASATLVEVTERLAAMGAWGYLPFPLLDLAEVACEREDVRTARCAASTMEEVARRADRPLHAGLASTTSAWAALAAKDTQSAASLAQQAALQLAQTTCQALHGRALDCLGKALAPSDRGAAVDAFERAATIFDGCGASWRRDGALQNLRALGTRGRRIAAALGPEPLRAASRRSWISRSRVSPRRRSDSSSSSASARSRPTSLTPTRSSGSEPSAS